ncbi:MAG: hypothetical protein R2720_00945 [Candidatus Nanopelagicales bacterium]
MRHQNARDITLPPGYAFPEPLRAHVEKFTAMQAALADAEAAVAPLVRAVEAAKVRADAARADAVRNGDDPQSVDDDIDQREHAVEVARQNEAAHARALALEWLSGGLEAELRTAAAAESRRWAQECQTRRQDVVDALAVLTAAQARWVRAASMQAFHTRQLAGARTVDYGGLAVADGDAMPFEGFAGGAALLDSMASVTAYLHRRGPDAPPPPAAPDQPAAPDSTHRGVVRPPRKRHRTGDAAGDAARRAR